MRAFLVSTKFPRTSCSHTRSSCYQLYHGDDDDDDGDNDDDDDDGDDDDDDDGDDNAPPA